MNAASEFTRYQALVSRIRALRRSTCADLQAEFELIDELEIMELHADSPTIKAACTRALIEFRAAPVTADAVGG